MTKNNVIEERVIFGELRGADLSKLLTTKYVVNRLTPYYQNQFGRTKKKFQ